MTATHNNNNLDGEDLELRISTLIAQGRKLANELFCTHFLRAAYKCELQRPAWMNREEIALPFFMCSRGCALPPRPAWMIREELASIEEQLDLAEAELERRHI